MVNHERGVVMVKRADMNVKKFDKIHATACRRAGKMEAKYPELTDPNISEEERMKLVVNVVTYYDRLAWVYNDNHGRRM